MGPEGLPLVVVTTGAVLVEQSLPQLGITVCPHVAEAPLHWSIVQALPSLEHDVVAGLKASTGQLLVVPSHNSVTSHSPAEPRHCVPPGTLLSVGQAPEDPVQ